ncbi:MAG TPA: 2-hydroxychromene-2-carboxylate isomerase [Candidatus Binataceae bacterium]|nr:2-hydroxychromene-2-carboxylate isomerase [Candidatus Binataceae bacterium]
MAAEIDFYFDYMSPFSYLADTQLPALARRTGAKIAYRPVHLFAVFESTGNAPPIAVAAKRKYYREDIPRWARRYGVPWNLNSHFPFNPLRLMRGAIAAQQQGRFEALHPLAFRAMWVEGQNLGDKDVVNALLAQAGVDPAAVETDSIASLLKASTEEAVRRGAFGDPTFFVGDQMFWGNDRLDFVEEAVRAEN